MQKKTKQKDADDLPIYLQKLNAQLAKESLLKRNQNYSH